MTFAPPVLITLQGTRYALYEAGTYDVASLPDTLRRADSEAVSEQQRESKQLILQPLQKYGADQLLAMNVEAAEKTGFRISPPMNAVEVNEMLLHLFTQCLRTIPGCDLQGGPGGMYISIPHRGNPEMVMRTVETELRQLQSQPDELADRAPARLRMQRRPLEAHAARTARSGLAALNPAGHAPYAYGFSPRR